MSNFLLLQGLYISRLLCPCSIPGQNTGVGCHFLLQGIFLTQGLNPHLLRLLHGRQILYHRATFYNALLTGFNKTFVQLYLASLVAQQ